MCSRTMLSMLKQLEGLTGCGSCQTMCTVSYLLLMAMLELLRSIALCLSFLKISSIAWKLSRLNNENKYIFFHSEFKIVTQMDQYHTDMPSKFPKDMKLDQNVHKVTKGYLIIIFTDYSFRLPSLLISLRVIRVTKAWER